MMGDDEQNAFELLRQNRQLQKPLIEKFNGTWIKELGDGVLASFNTVTDAVMCASENQMHVTRKKIIDKFFIAFIYGQRSVLKVNG